MADITWFLNLVSVGGKIIEGGGIGLARSVARQFISSAIPLELKPMSIYRTLVNGGINYGRLPMLKDIRELSTLFYSQQKSVTAPADRVFPKSWMADIELPSHANYLVKFKVSYTDTLTGKVVEGYRSMYTEDRLSPNGWWDQLMESNESTYNVSAGFTFLGVESVTHNHGFGW